MSFGASPTSAFAANQAGGLPATSSPSTRPERQVREVFAKLAALRGALRWTVGLAGVNWAVCAVFGFVAVTLIVDYSFWVLLWQSGGLAVTYRVTLSGLGAVALVGVVWRYLVEPLRVVKVSDLDLALRVERHFPSLQDRLVSAVQFHTRPVGPGSSPALMAHTVAQARQHLVALDLGEIFDRRGLREQLVYGVTAVGILVALVAAPPTRPGQSSLMAVWFERNVLFRDVPYPGWQAESPRFELIVQTGPAGAGRYRAIDDTTLGVLGDAPLDVVVRAEKVVPDETGVVMPQTVMLRVAGEAFETPVSAEGQANRFAHEFARVVSDFEFTAAARTVQSGEVVSRLMRVVVEAPPALRRWSVLAVPPAYTGMRPTRFDQTARDISVESEGTIVLMGEADHGIAQVQATLQGAPASEGADPPPPVVVTVDLTARGPADATNPKGQSSPSLSRQFEIAIPAEHPGMAILNVSLLDERGYSNPQAVRDLAVRVRLKDQPPKVVLRHPGVRDKITPAAALRFELRAEDDRGLLLGVNPLDAENLGQGLDQPTAWPGAYMMFRVRAFGGEGQSGSATLEGSGGRPLRVRLPAAVLPNPAEVDDSVPTVWPPSAAGATTETADGMARWVWAPNAAAGADSSRQLFSPGDRIDVWVVVHDNCRRPKPVSLVNIAGFVSGTDVLTYRDPAECASEVLRLTVIETDEMLRLLTNQRRELVARLRKLKERQENLARDVSRVSDAVAKSGIAADEVIRDLLTNRVGEQANVARGAGEAAKLLGDVYVSLEINSLTEARDRQRLWDQVVLPLRCMSAGVVRTAREMAGDPWLKETPAARAGELARLAAVTAALNQRLGAGPLLEDLAGELNDLINQSRRLSPEKFVEAARTLATRQRLAAQVFGEVTAALQSDIRSSLDELVRQLRERVIREQEQVRRDTEKLADTKARSFLGGD